MPVNVNPEIYQCPSCGKGLKCCGTPLYQMPEDFLRRLGASLMSITRPKESRIGGKPKVLYPCSWCKKKFPAGELKTHRPQCSKRPADAMGPKMVKGRRRAVAKKVA